MTVLHSVDFFPSGNASVAIEPRLPQADFPEHHHDFHEIVIVEHGTGIHVFNGQPLYHHRWHGLFRTRS
ncbi:L-rhamnose operon regulatory protein [Escherichia coli]|nr:L-rhamnose operon regulatory protein [Escherichia coli]